MTNFDYLLQTPKFSPFSQTAVNAEKLYQTDLPSCVFCARRALEFAVKWMYSVDTDLKAPAQYNLYSLITSEDFKNIVDANLLKKIDFIRILGNDSAHANKPIKPEQAVLALKNLFDFLDFVAYCYGDSYTERRFDSSLLTKNEEKEKISETPDIDLEKLIEENKALKAELTKRREEKAESYTAAPLELTEYKTRKIYIDTMLQNADWTEGKNWLNEVELKGMPNKSGVGYADYVLYGDDGKPLAVIEAKRTCEDVEKGRQQAKLYADILEKQFGRRPVIFLTNGFETRIIDNVYPERKTAAVYSKRDLEKLFNLRAMRTSLFNVHVNTSIAGRYYQKAAIKAVCDSFDKDNRRKALLVMATGSGKTRTIIGLCDMLLQHGWVKNILFLADRNSLVTQAKRSFVNLLPNLSVTNLCEDKDNYNAHCVFSTYQTMINCIDDVKDSEGRLFTCGHFDLVVCDEAHRSIYNKYKDIFNYFDAHLIGMTATPKDEIDKNTYDIFDLDKGDPTYGYELAQAVKDGFLVDFISVDTKLKFIEQGIVYDELSDEDKEEYENTFRNEDGELPEKISSSALNEWIFNEDTIKEVLHILMSSGLKIDYGGKIGKTIIFAKNHRHAEKIFEIFNKEYPSYKDYAKVIDNKLKYAQSAIDEFSDSKKLPQIAISVDMLDTGIDVPEVLNLVFFKKVMSKAKFWQMIGRGTRLCPKLIDGEDKSKFYIFDFCGNFEFFRMNKGKETDSTVSIQGTLFLLKSKIACRLQELNYQTEELTKFRKRITEELLSKVRELNRENFAVKQHLKYVDIYSDEKSYLTITENDILVIKDELIHLILPDNDDPKALRFDALMYGMELAYLSGKSQSRYRSDLFKKVSAVSSVANIPEIKAQSELIDKILHTNYVEAAGIGELEHIRQSLRDLIKYIPDTVVTYITNFDDEILSMEWNESELNNDDLREYKERAESYIRNNQDNKAIAKLKGNIPLTDEDISELEKILWSELGTKQDYESEYGQKPLGELVREITGLDMNAAKNAFAEYLDNTNLDAKQIYFVNQIVEYIVQNGLMKDFSVLQEAPFTDMGGVSEVFKDMAVWVGIRKVIEGINRNAVA